MAGKKNSRTQSKNWKHWICTREANTINVKESTKKHFWSRYYVVNYDFNELCESRHFLCSLRNQKQHRLGRRVNQMAKKQRVSTAKCFRGETLSTDGGDVPGLCVRPQTRWKNKGGAEENQISTPLMAWLSCAPHFLIWSHGGLRTRESPIHLFTCNI